MKTELEPQDIEAIADRVTDNLKPYQKTSLKGAFIDVESHYGNEVIVE